MSQIEKLINRFYSKPIPKDITLDEVMKLSHHYGCTIKTGGNHQIRIAHIESGTIIPIPHHGKCIKEAYIEELKALFSKIEGTNEVRK